MLSKKSVFISSAIALLILLPLAGLKLVARAAAPLPKTTAAAKGFDPKALALLTQMEKAYGALKSYSGTETLYSDSSMDPYETIALKFQRPGRYLESLTSPGNGQTVVKIINLNRRRCYVFSSDHPHKISKLTASPNGMPLFFRVIDIMAHGDATAPLLLAHSRFLTDNLTHNPSMKLNMGRPGSLDGVPVDTIIMKGSANPALANFRMTIQIGRRDHLIRRILTDDNTDGFKQMQNFLFTHVVANPVLATSTFTFTPAKGAKIIDGPIDFSANSNADPKAVALLTQMYAADAALKSFSCMEKIITNGSNGKAGGIPPGYISIHIQKPNKINISSAIASDDEHAISDGNVLFVTTTAGKTVYHAAPTHYLALPLKNDANWMYDLSNYGGLPQPIIGSDQQFVPQAILGAIVMPAADYNWKMGAPGFVEGVPVDTVTLMQKDSNDANYSIITLSISSQDHLLRMITTAYHMGRHSVQTNYDIYERIKLNPLFPATEFVFTPPSGAQPVSTANALFANP